MYGEGPLFNQGGHRVGENSSGVEEIRQIDSYGDERDVRDETTSVRSLGCVVIQNLNVLLVNK